MHLFQQFPQDALPSCSVLLWCLLSHAGKEPQRINPAMVVRKDAESFQDPEPLLLSVPPPPLPGCSVQL